MADLEGAVATLSAHVETDADAAIDRDVEDFQAEFGSLAISSADHAEWVIAKLLDRQSQRDRLKAQYEAMDRELEHDMRGLAFRFGAPLEGYVRSRLTGNKRSVKTLHGTAGLRTVGGGFRLADKQAAAEWALGQTAPELFGAFAFNVDSKALAKHAKVTGEIPDGLEAKATRDTFYVASGGVRVDVGALATPSTSSALERNDDNQDEEEIRS